MDPLQSGISGRYDSPPGLRYLTFSAPTAALVHVACWVVFLLLLLFLRVDGVLDEMYGGGGEGGGDSDQDGDQGGDSSDEEQDEEMMMEELMQEDAESGDEQVGGGIKHGDFFDDEDDAGG